MNTGAMTGADVPALRALAGQMSASAARLDGMRQSVRARLYSINWQGPDGADFRRAWDGQHAPMLSRVAEGLRASAQNLLREAAQQEAASAAGRGASGSWGTGGSSIGVKEIAKGFGVFVGTAKTLLKALIEDATEKVRGHPWDDRWVDEYHRWAKGKADELNRLFGPVQGVVDDLDKVSKVGKVLPFVGAGFDFHEQWTEDSGKYDDSERLVRATSGAAAVAGVEAGFTFVGGAIGTLIPIPVVGTAVGGFIGITAGTIVTTVWGDEITDAGAWVGSRIYDVAEFQAGVQQAAVDLGRETLASGRDLLETGSDLAEDAGRTARRFLGGIRPWVRS